jgi:SAM-dependent methyltransferase
LQLIDETTRSGGMVLDCGAGFRPSRMRNVINLEISKYRSTDVLAAGEKLPFADASFDAVLSLAVLEHVRDPFACAREMLRVVKPGGKIMCAVPFLQPEHHFPGHFYNMTQTGLENLFGGHAALISAEVPPHGHPIFAVQWILRDYLAGLTPDAQHAFSAMTIGQAAALNPAEFLSSEMARSLSPDATQKIACLNTLVFQRPP